MKDIKDGESTEMKGSGIKPYILQNTGGVYSCTCPAWRNQSQPIEKRTCKHLRKLRGDEAEQKRLGGSLVMKGAKTKKKTTKVPPALLLAHKWTPDVDPSGWWVSEKLDGVRAYWNGKQMLSRLGNPFYVPATILKMLPKDVHLDGELWIDRGMFQKTVSVVRRQDFPEEWAKIKYIVFDAVPDGKVIKEDATFEERTEVIKSLVKECNSAFIKILSHTVCKDVNQLKELLEYVEKKKGEGLMLRQANSIYERGRSHTLLKVKSFVDTEAMVIGYTPGTGRHKGRTGALMVKLENGKEFKVGTGLSDADRDNPPAAGSIITVRYTELTKDGIPRFPVYIGPAIDK